MWYYVDNNMMSHVYLKANKMIIEATKNILDI